MKAMKLSTPEQDNKQTLEQEMPFWMGLLLSFFCVDVTTQASLAGKLLRDHDKAVLLSTIWLVRVTRALREYNQGLENKLV